MSDPLSNQLDQAAAAAAAQQRAASAAAAQQASSSAGGIPIQQHSAQPDSAAFNTAFGRLLNKPDEYDGKDRNACHTFISQCNLFIMGNGHLFPTEASKVLFASTYLRGKAFAWLEPRLSDVNALVLNDFSVFTAELLRNLGDPDREKTMARKLRQLKQTGSTAAYRTEFDNIVQYLNWDDGALRTYFYEGLKDQVKDTLAQTTAEPTAFKDYQDFCVKIDNRLYERKQEGKGSSGNSKAAPSNNNKSSNGNKAVTSQRSTTTTTTSSGPAPMDLDANSGTRKFKPLTPQEKQHRMDNNLCLYCGKPGHRATDCPAKKNKGHRVQATLPGPDSSSGNE